MTGVAFVVKDYPASLMLIKFPCQLCKKSCKTNENSIFCDTCSSWIHLKCTQQTIKQFESLGTSELPYFCEKCCTTIFPFQNSNNDELLNEFALKKSNLNSITEEVFDIQNVIQHIPDINLELDQTYISADKFKKKYKNSPAFCLLHINIRSLTKNLEKLEELLSDLDKMPEIIAISETKLKAEFKLQLDGYDFLQKDSSTNAGGVGLFISKSLNYEVIEHYHLHNNDCEELWVKIKMRNKVKIFGVIYRHPKSSITEFYNSFEKTLSLLNKQKAEYYITGDFNIDLIQCDTNEAQKTMQTCSTV